MLVASIGFTVLGWLLYRSAQPPLADGLRRPVLSGLPADQRVTASVVGERLLRVDIDPQPKSGNAVEGPIEIIVNEAPSGTARTRVDEEGCQFEISVTVENAKLIDPVTGTKLGDVRVRLQRGLPEGQIVDITLAYPALRQRAGVTVVKPPATYGGRVGDT